MDRPLDSIVFSQAPVKEMQNPSRNGRRRSEISAASRRVLRADGKKASQKIIGETANRSQKRFLVIQRFRASRQIAREVTLMIVGSLAEAIEPIDKAEDWSLHFCNLSFRS